MKDTIRTVLALACLCAVTSASLCLSPVPVRAQTLGQQANEAADEVTQALKKELLDRRLENFAGNFVWELMGGDSELSRYLLNTSLTNNSDFNRFLTDDAFAEQHISKIQGFLNSYKYYLHTDQNSNEYGDQKRIDTFWYYIRILYPLGAPFLPGLAS